MVLAPSAPAQRLIDLVTFLAARPGDDFNVSELARGAELNRTTCLSMLRALEARGWVQRRNGSRYSLGPALIPIGEAALAGLRLADEVQPELDSLVADLGLEALASTVSADEIVVVAHATTGTVLTNTVRLGQTIPFVPPFGLAHLVHAPAEAVEAWLDRARVTLTDQERAEYRDMLAQTERLGYVVVLDAASRRRFEATVAELALQPSSRSARRQRDELLVTLARERQVLGPWTGSENAEVSQVQAPVFGPDGRPALAIGVHGLPHLIDPSRMDDYSGRVLAAADRLTARLHGRRPEVERR